MDEDLTDEQKQYRKEYDEQVTEAQELINAPKSKARNIKKWDHIAVRPGTFEEFRAARGSEYKSDDAFVIELLKVFAAKEAQAE